MLQGEGYNDFPFTQNGLTVTASGTGTYSSYSSTYTFYTITFSSGVNDIVCNITAANSAVFGVWKVTKTSWMQA